MVKDIRKIIADGKLVRGTHTFFGMPMITEAITLCGFDVVWIDMEHTPITKESVCNNLIAVKAGGASAFVRIPWNDPVLAKPIIDMGVDGIIFPYIRTVDEVRLAVASCTYPPEGTRGYGPMRALEYGNLDKCDFVDRKYREMMRIIQVEHIDLIDHLEEIAEMEGVDGFIVGPNDLSGSVGHIGRPQHPDMFPIYDKIGKALRNSGKLFGVSLGYDKETIEQWLGRGVNTIFTGTDVEYIHNGAVDIMNKLNEMKRR